MTPDDLASIERFLIKDPTRSCRSIARETGYSDWTIRKIARRIRGDDRPMRQPRSPIYEAAYESPDVSPVVAWLGFGVFLAVLALAIWAGLRYLPPVDPRDFPPVFHSDPST